MLVDVIKQTLNDKIIQKYFLFSLIQKVPFNCNNNADIILCLELYTMTIVRAHNTFQMSKM